LEGDLKLQKKLLHSSFTHDVEATRVQQVENHCCSRAQTLTNTTNPLAKTFLAGNQFDWNSAHLALERRLTALQQIISTGNYVSWNPGREAAKRFLHSIESLRFNTIQERFTPTVKYFFKHRLRLWWI